MSKVCAWAITRRAPYTKAGIKRLRCIRCGARAQFQWRICSDGNNHRPLCGRCDVLLNRMVLAWMGHPAAEELMELYTSNKEQNHEPIPNHPRRPGLPG